MLLILFLLFFSPAYNAGISDGYWHKKRIGYINYAYFDSINYSLVFVGSAQGVLATLDTHTGSILQRQVLPEYNLDYLKLNSKERQAISISHDFSHKEKHIIRYQKLPRFKLIHKSSFVFYTQSNTTKNDFSISKICQSNDRNFYKISSNLKSLLNCQKFNLNSNEEKNANKFLILDILKRKNKILKNSLLQWPVFNELFVDQKIMLITDSNDFSNVNKRAQHKINKVNINFFEFTLDSIFSTILNKRNTSIQNFTSLETFDFKFLEAKLIHNPKNIFEVYAFALYNSNNMKNYDIEYLSNVTTLSLIIWSINLKNEIDYNTSFYNNLDRNSAKYFLSLTKPLIYKSHDFLKLPYSIMKNSFILHDDGYLIIFVKTGGDEYDNSAQKHQFLIWDIFDRIKKEDLSTFNETIFKEINMNNPTIIYDFENEFKLNSFDFSSIDIQSISKNKSSIDLSTISYFKILFSNTGESLIFSLKRMYNFEKNKYYGVNVYIEKYYLNKSYIDQIGLRLKRIDKSKDLWISSKMLKDRLMLKIESGYNNTGITDNYCFYFLDNLTFYKNGKVLKIFDNLDLDTIQYAQNNSKSCTIKGQFLIVNQDYKISFIENGVFKWSREESLSDLDDILILNNLEIENKKQKDISYLKIFYWMDQAIQSILNFDFYKNFIESCQSFISKILKREFTYIKNCYKSFKNYFFLKINTNYIPDNLHQNFGFHKIIISCSNSGKLFAIDSITGNIIWTYYLLPLINIDHGINVLITASPKIWFTRIKVKTDLKNQTNSLKSVIMIWIKTKFRKKDNTNDYLFAVDLYTGVLVDFVNIGSDIKAKLEVKRKDILSFLDKKIAQKSRYKISQKFFVFINSSFKIAFIWPQTEFSLLNQNIENYLAKKGAFTLVKVGKGSTITGYRFYKNENNNTLIEEHQKIMLPISELISNIDWNWNNHFHIYEQSRSIDSIDESKKRDTYQKYLNPNLIIISTVSLKSDQLPIKNDQNYFYPFIVVYIIDSISGEIVFRKIHFMAKGPIQIMFVSENRIVYSYKSLKREKYKNLYNEFIVIELNQLRNSNNFKSFSLPLSHEQKSMFEQFPVAFGSTKTRLGITPRNLLVATENGQIINIFEKLLDPLLTVHKSESLVENAISSNLILPFIHDVNIVNKQFKIEKIKHLKTDSVHLESTSFLFAAGIDIFACRLKPSSNFDMLSYNFNYFYLILSILLLYIFIIIFDYFLKRRLLSKQQL